MRAPAKLFLASSNPAKLVEFRTLALAMRPSEALSVELLPHFASVPEFEESVNGEKFNLTELVSQMPSDYQVSEENFGEPVGKEEW